MPDIVLRECRSSGRMAGDSLCRFCDARQQKACGTLKAQDAKVKEGLKGMTKAERAHWDNEQILLKKALALKEGE